MSLSDESQATAVLQAAQAGDRQAAVLGVAERTLDRHWRYIRVWLMKRLS